MHRKFDIRRYLTAFFVGIFAIVGTIVAIDAPARAATGDASTVDYALSLNGTSDYLEAAEGTQYVSRAIYTVQAWAKPSNVTCATGSICTIASHDGDWWIGIENSKFVFLVYQAGQNSHTGYIDTGVTAVANSWSHVSLVRNNTAITFYVNGVAVKTTTVTSGRSTYSGYPIKVGAHYGSYFSGQVDELKIWSMVRDAAAIATDMHTYQTSASTTSGLLAYFDFNEGGSNTTVNNRVGTGANLTFVNASPTVNFVDVKSTSKANGKTVVSFPRSYLTPAGGWTVPAGVTRAEVLAVAGGGSGGSRHAGGGGAGELLTTSSYSTTPGSAVTLKVGQGGVGGPSLDGGISDGANGQNTIVGSTTLVGGGRGAGGYALLGLGGGANGAGVDLGTIPSPTNGLRNLGGAAATNGTYWVGGGGGGAGSAGNPGTIPSTGPFANMGIAGAGGSGFQSSITGTATCYAAGGGGGSLGGAERGLGGTCSGGASSTGGAGSKGSEVQSNSGAYFSYMQASPNSGSGGGGGGLGTNWNGGGGSGGSGVIVIAYAQIEDSAWDFVGASDNKYVATSKQIIPSKASFTFESWLKADSLKATGWNAIFRQQATSSNYLSFEVGIYSKRIQVISSLQSTDAGTFNTHVANDSRTILNTGQWYHLAVSSDFSTSGSNTINVLKVFLDGAEVFSATKTIATTSLANLGSAQLSIGGLYSATDRGWDGQLDQLKVWNGALTQSELQKSMHTYDSSGVVSTSGATLRALYDFNSATTTSLIDQTGNGYDFAPTTNASAPTVSNVRDAAVSGDTTTFTFTRSYLTTWGGWIPEATTSAARVLAVGAGGGGAENVGAGGSGGGISYATGKSLSPSAAVAITVGQGGAGGSYYLNNSSDSQTATSLRDGSNGQDSKVGFATAMVGTGGVGGQTYWLDNKCSGTGNNNVNSTGIAGTGGTTNSAGGTGGKGAAGSGNGFAGSAGFATTIRGTSETFGGGGGGGSFGGTGAVGGNGGSGGGGAGASAGGAAGAAGSANTGGGGGGGSVTCGAGANGGSGIVIASMKTANSISFDSNGGSGTLSAQYINIGSSANLSTNSFTKTGYAFGGWATSANGSVVHTDGASITPSGDLTLYAVWTLNMPSVDVNFDELNFDFANVVHVVGTNGKALGNKVLFLNVTTKNGVQVDALVTTETLTNATITNYETGARAGGANSYFQTDVDFSAANGFAQFKFDFYQHGASGAAGNPCTVANPTCTGSTKVILQNVNVSAIDIDYYQWNDFTQAESYTVAGNTKLKECLISVANAAAGGTCTARTAPSTFPADMRFQGSPDTARTNDPVDMAIVTYASIETFRIKFGKSTSTNPNYYGVAFKALDWGVATPQTKGGTNYTISYDTNGESSGSQAGTHVGAAGSSFTVLSAGTAVKTGHTFAGWATSSTATTANYTASSKVTMPGSNLTLYAVWTPVKYTLTYNVNGGSGAPAAGSFDTGTNNVTLSSTVPTRAGYVFGGWDTVVNSGSGNNNYSSGATYSMPASNTTLYAKWTIANGTLAYNGNNGTTTEANVTAAGNTTTTVASGSNTSRTGYDFVGWNSKADGTGTSYAVGSTFILQATVTTTIYAQWTLSKYTLVFNVNGGTGTPQSQSYVQGATTTMPVTNPTRAGYNFAGWNSQADGAGTNYTGSFLMPGNNLTLYAKWTPITYNVIYNNNSATYSGATGTVSDSTNYTSAQSVTVAAGTGLSNTTGGTAYRFIGWNTQANGSGTDYVAGATFSMPASNTTLYAMWLDASVEIAYNANGGTGAPANDDAVINTRYDIQTGAPTKSGYTFAGWLIADGSPAGTYKVGATPFFSPDSNFETLVAQWTAVDYTVSYDTDGGSTAPTTLTAKHIGDTITVDASAPTKTGYTFLGWKDAAGNIYPAGGTFVMGAGNVGLTAQWQGNAYTLTYDANSGSGAPVAETRNYTATANLSLVEPVRTGYTFQGWNTLVGGGGTAKAAGASFQMPNSNTTLFAQWTVNNFLLAYNTQGGSTAPTGGSTDYNVEVTVSGSTPTRTGYSFAGWNTAANGSGTTYLQSSKFRMPNANVTLYAQWTKTAFTLYYNTNGGQGVFSSQPVKYSESVTVDSTTPTKTGYTFSGWNTAADGSGFDFNPMGVFTLNVESNVTLYAKWTPISYSLAYNANTGSGAPAGASHNFGATVTTALKGSMSLSGYRFIGWNTRADGSGSTYIEGATFAMPAENVILYAQWIDALFEIAYNANGGSGGPDGADIADGTSYTVDSIEPIRPGYTFSGWKLADGTPTTSTYKAGTGTQSFTISGNEVLVAQWTIKTITVTYDLNGGGGTTPSAGSGNYDSNITLASSSGVSRANFQFVGWSTTPDGSGTTYVDGSTYKLPANDVTLYAKWAPVYYIIEYNPAGGSGEPADQFATPSSTVAIATQEPTKAGYEFDKWTEVSQGTDFTPGSSLTMPSSNVVLVANYTVRSASVPGTGGGSNTGVIDPGTKPISKPKQLVLSVYFKGDSPVLTTNTKNALKKLAATAKTYGRANNITIYGRVKETNDKSYDMRLSKARAANVAAFLKKYGVTGEYKVYAKGISPENTFRSRRVDLKLWWAK